MIDRRLLIGATGLVAAGAVAWGFRNPIARSMMASATGPESTLTDALLQDATLCRLTPQQEEGPFFVRSPVRQDIREDRSGIPLTLTLKLVAADGCTPLPTALVEIWHCDAAGRYSAYPENISRAPFETFRLIATSSEDGHVARTNEKTYLRGAQATDTGGRVSFRTILPGWYDPRMPHIHVKAFLEDSSILTTQLYFPKELTDEAFKIHPDYAPHGACPYSEDYDPVLARFPNADGLLLRPVSSAEGLTASALLGIA